MTKGILMPVSAVLALIASSTMVPPVIPFDISSRTLIARFHAEGAQIYECKAMPNGSVLVWTFREPIATLIDNGKTVGRHFAGPQWALDDGSLLKARVAQTAPGPTSADIPSLKLDVSQNNGRGQLGSATEVYRVNTHLGTLEGACSTLGEVRSMPYSADYVFTR
jgi:hypothetical protein